MDRLSRVLKASFLKTAILDFSRSQNPAIVRTSESYREWRLRTGFPPAAPWPALLAVFTEFELEILSV